MDNAALNDAIGGWYSEGLSGFYITLNSLKNDRICFEQDIGRFAHKLNDYCYGRLYKRRLKRLKMLGSIEQGSLNGILHTHLLVGHDADMKRSFYDVNAFTRKQWYQTLNLKNSYGNMVNVAHLNELSSRISYTTKDTNYFMRSNNFNIVAF